MYIQCNLLVTPITAAVAVASFRKYLENTGAVLNDLLILMNPNKGVVNIDLSGQYECQITGPPTEGFINQRMKHSQYGAPHLPLFFVEKSPFLHVGFTYNLHPNATSVVAPLGTIRASSRNHKLQNWNIGNSIFAKLQWNYATCQVAVEKIRRKIVVSSLIQLQLFNINHPSPQETSLEWRANSMHQHRLVARLPMSFHRRQAGPFIHVEYHALWNSRFCVVKEPLLDIDPTLQNESDPWIPSIQMTTSGRLESCNTWSWGCRKQGSATVRLSQSLGWFGDSDTLTRLRFDVTQRFSNSHTTSLSLQGIPSDWGKTMYVTLCHEHDLLCRKMDPLFS